MEPSESEPLLADTAGFREAVAASFGSVNSSNAPKLELEFDQSLLGDDTPDTHSSSSAPLVNPVGNSGSDNGTVSSWGNDSGPHQNRTGAAATCSAAHIDGATGHSNSIASAGEESQFNPDETTLLQACVFIEDAISYRSIHHRIDKSSLVLYRFYYSRIVQWILYFVICTLHILAFFENPSSLTLTSDLRTRGPQVVLPCGAMESIELLCLLILLVDLVLKSYLKGKTQFFKSKWLWMSALVIGISLVDWCVTVGYMCTELVRVRRMLRPFFLLQNSSIMKKTVNCLRKTMPHVVSVLLLLFMHLVFFTLFGMLLFPKEESHGRKQNHTSEALKADEYSDYFRGPVESFMSLLILITTANNPDVTMPAYSANRFYAMFFMVFLMIGLYCLMNMLTAVIYNQFRGYFSDSIQSSLFRRRLGIRAAFEVLRKRRVALKYSSSFATISQGVPLHFVENILHSANIDKTHREAMIREMESLPGRLLDYAEFQAVFSILDLDLSRNPRPEIRVHDRPCLQVLQRIVAHRFFNYFGCGMAFANVLCITLELALEYDHVRSSRNTYLGIFNLVFVAYFCVEQCLKVWALGWNRYAWDKGNLFDGVVTILLMIVQGVYVSIYGIPFWGKDHDTNRGITLWDLVRIINMLIMIRLLRMVVSQIRSMSIVASTLIDLVKNLKAFAGILVVIFYSYALLGMECFSGVIKYPVQNITGPQAQAPCGTYEQLEYWANNFDDFASSLVVLWDIMVVNNWHVFLRAYAKYSSGWAQLYFIIWWLISVVISLNLFTALILENFIMRWDRLNRQQPEQQTPGLEESYRVDYITIHDLFRPTIQEPSEDSLVVELRQHPYFEDVS